MNRLLIIEDDGEIRQVLSEVLAGEGYSVITAPNAKDALAMLEADPGVFLVLLDLMMPVMNGWEFLKTRAKNPSLSQIPVLVMSALQDRPSEISADRFFSKPLNLDRLLDKIRMIANDSE